MFDLVPFDRKNNSLWNTFDNFTKSIFGNANTEIFECRTDIQDKGDHYLLEADLPGFSKEDISIDINGDYLTINAVHREEKEDKDEKGNYIRRERCYGSYSRSFDISNIQAEGIQAGYDNGVLRLQLPKAETQKPKGRNIPIQ